VFEDPAQDPPSLEPERRRQLSGPSRWRKGADRSTALRVEGATG